MATVNQSQKKKRVYTQEQRDRKRAYMRVYYRTRDIEKRKARAKQDWLNRDLGHERNLRRKRRYGLLPGQFELLAANQGGVCALCHRKPPVTVDHCHKTGRVRGLLCYSCNVGLGHFGDSVDQLVAAIAYLQAFLSNPI